MTVIINIIIKLMPFLQPLIDKFSGKNDNVEMKTQRDLEELRVFSMGKLTPHYLLRYITVALFALFALLLIISLFFPEVVTSPDLQKFKDVVTLGIGFGN